MSGTQRVASASAVRRNGKLDVNDPGNNVVFRTSSLALVRAPPRSHASVKEIFARPEYSSCATKVMDFLYDAWQTDRICDVVVHVPNGEYHLHKVVLAAYSQPLAATFAEFLPGEAASIDMTDYASDVVFAVLNYLYTGTIEINVTNVGPIMTSAQELSIAEIVKMCSDFLKNYNTDTAILYYSVCENNGLTALATEIYKFICDNFVDVVNSPHFAFVPLDRILHMLEDDNLCIYSELDVFFAIVRWINFNRKERLTLAAKILSCVRFQLITPEQIALKVENVDFMTSQVECQHVLYDSMKFHAIKLSGSSLISQYPVQKPRRLARREIPIHYNVSEKELPPVSSNPARPPLAKVDTPRHGMRKI